MYANYYSPTFNYYSPTLPTNSRFTRSLKIPGHYDYCPPFLWLQFTKTSIITLNTMMDVTTITNFHQQIYIFHDSSRPWPPFHNSLATITYNYLQFTTPLHAVLPYDL